MQGETNELNAFHDVEFGLPEGLVGRIDADSEDDGGDMETNAVNDNHPKDVT